MKNFYYSVALSSLITISGCTKQLDTVGEKLSEAENNTLVSIPLEFKGIKLGQSQEEIQSVFSGLRNSYIYQSDYVLSCNDEIETEKCELVNNLTIANHKPTSAIFTFNSENKLTYDDPKSNFLKSLDLTVDEKYFEEIASALLTKYGEPSTNYEETLHNKHTGAETKVRLLMWVDSQKNTIGITNHMKDGSTYTPSTGFRMYNQLNSERDETPAESDI